MAVERDAADIVVVTADGSRLVTDAILVAAGRSPRVAVLDLDAVDAGGFVAVDGELRTSNPGSSPPAT